MITTVKMANVITVMTAAAEPTIKPMSVDSLGLTVRIDRSVSVSLVTGTLSSVPVISMPSELPG